MNYYHASFTASMQALKIRYLRLYWTPSDFPKLKFGVLSCATIDCIFDTKVATCQIHIQFVWWVVGNVRWGAGLFAPIQSNRNFWVFLERVLNATNSPLPTDCPVAERITTWCVTINASPELSSFSFCSNSFMTSCLSAKFWKNEFNPENVSQSLKSSNLVVSLHRHYSPESTSVKKVLLLFSSAPIAKACCRPTLSNLSFSSPIFAIYD